MAFRRVIIRNVDGVSLDASHFASLITMLEQMSSVIPLRVFRVARNEQTPTLYHYEFTALDGRTWDQDIDMSTAPSDPPMTFDVPTGWKPSEFILQRPIRDLIISLVTAYQITEVTVRWVEA